VKNTNRRRDGEDDIIPRIMIDPPDILDPKIFSDWIADLDYYFACIDSQKRVKFSLLG